jgi:membrane carboxypeptidase/penicillin-binding protein
MKTGSGQLSDLWAVAVTPKLITVVWVGCDKNAPLPSEDGWGGGATAAPVWARFARAIRPQRPALFEGSFRPPAGVVRLEIDPGRGCQRRGGGVYEYFLRDRLPPLCAPVIASNLMRPS